jgi:hypothetical protein
MKRALVFLLFCVGTMTAYAQELKPFVRNSQQTILSAHEGKPFILALWSLDCAYCGDDLGLLGKTLARHHGMPVIVISTDNPAQSDEILSTLKRYKLQGAESWVFADRFTERLRHEIDPQWHGELPRLYLYGADGKATAYSGKIEHSTIEHWIKTNTQKMRN